MVEVASMEMVFTAVTTGLEKGLEITEKSMKKVASLAGNTTTDMIRMGSATLDTSLKLAKFGLIGAGAMTALASRSPAMAPAMASFEIEMFKLGNTMGEILAPHMETLLGHFSNLVTWVGENKEDISGLVGSFVDMGEAVGTVLIPPLQQLAEWAFDNKETFEGIAGGFQDMAAALVDLGVLTGVDVLREATTPLAGLGEGDYTGALAAFPNIVTGGLLDAVLGAIGFQDAQQTRKDMLLNAVDSIGGVFG